MAEIYEARDFALKAHGDPKYGEEPYGVHLFAVVQVARDFDCTNAQWKAAFLHDVLEDTDTTWQQLSAKFGGEVTSLVLACTGVGHNRKTRNASIYRQISDYPPAAFVKLADRIANVEASEPGSSHRAMYAREMPAFEAVIRPHVPAAMWARLERAFA